MPPPELTPPSTAYLLTDLPNTFDHAPWAVTEVSGHAHIVRYANSAFCRLIGSSREEVIGSPFDDLLPQADHCLTLLDRVLRTGLATSYLAEETQAPLPLLFSYNLWPVIAGGRTAGVIIQVNETGPLHETRQAVSQALLLGALRQNEMIEAADLANVRLQIEISERREREKEAKLLTNEIAHRVKNNLQVVTALIRNEIRRTPEPWVQGYLATQARIMAIAQLYDLMSQSAQDGTVDIREYFKAISKTLSASLLGDTSGIRIAVEAEAIEIDAERGVPLGLLANELITNAVKHAFPHGTGLVTIAVGRFGNDIEMKITDDGIGVAALHHESTPGKHGSDYITIFVRQLKGALIKSAEPDAGTTVRVRFPFCVS